MKPNPDENPQKNIKTGIGNVFIDAGCCLRYNAST
jgi:hypothetical protein